MWIVDAMEAEKSQMLHKFGNKWKRVDMHESNMFNKGASYSKIKCVNG